jgi:outer membrane protein assembly factor BamD
MFRIFLFFSLFALISCSKSYQNVLKSTDPDYKLTKADEYYEKEDYIKAIPLYEELLITLKGKKNLEDLYYKYANSHYEKGDYLIAAFHFRKYVGLYSSSSKVEEAYYKIAKCFYNKSPKYRLDQTSTIDAIKEFQRFVDRFPTSERISEANELIDELRMKLHAKAYDNAILYFKMQDYNASAYAFKALIDEFPESKDVEESTYYIAKSYKLYADNSYQEKKLERYKETLQACLAFKSTYPSSKYINEIEQILSESKIFIYNHENSKNDDRKAEGRN